MMSFIKRLFYTPPTSAAYYGLLDDYNTLVRLARRCAYDLRHTVDAIPQDHFMIARLRMNEAANYWTSLFAKGNPGKDYRLKMHSEIEDLRKRNDKLLKLCRDNNVDVTSVIGADIPF